MLDDRQCFLQRVVGGAVIPAADRTVDGDAPGSVTLPILCEGYNFRALCRGKSAAAGTDEKHQGFSAFLERDRMAVLICKRNAVCGVAGGEHVASGQCRGEACEQQAADTD